jgi:glyoxylase-like metal-dependent hydrolase (beta-lactamase superfamily II)
MVIDRLVLGGLQTNCYCLRASKGATQCLIIDTGAGGAGRLIDFLKQNGLTPAAVIFTHGHHDHIGGATLLRSYFPEIIFVIHKDDANALRELAGDLRAAPIEEDGPIELGGIKLEVLHTPGHTPGGICLYSKSRRVVFTGDTLFAGAIGRTDSRGGTDRLVQGIREKLLVLPEEVVVFPGHGPSTKIGREKRFSWSM